MSKILGPQTMRGTNDSLRWTPDCATELTCKIDLTSHLYLQPSLHAIFMPDAPDVFQGAATLRLGVTF